MRPLCNTDFSSSGQRTMENVLKVSEGKKSSMLTSVGVLIALCLGLYTLYQVMTINARMSDLTEAVAYLEESKSDESDDEETNDDNKEIKSAKKEKNNNNATINKTTMAHNLLNSGPKFPVLQIDNAINREMTYQKLVDLQNGLDMTYKLESPIIDSQASIHVLEDCDETVELHQEDDSRLFDVNIELENTDSVQELINQNVVDITENIVQEPINQNIVDTENIVQEPVIEPMKQNIVDNTANIVQEPINQNIVDTENIVQEPINQNIVDTENIVQEPVIEPIKQNIVDNTENVVQDFKDIIDIIEPVHIQTQIIDSKLEDIQDVEPEKKDPHEIDTIAISNTANTSKTSKGKQKSNVSIKVEPVSPNISAPQSIDKEESISIALINDQEILESTQRRSTRKRKTRTIKNK